MKLETPQNELSPVTPEQISQWKEDFNRDGFLLIPGLLNTDEIETMKRGVDRVLDDDRFVGNRHGHHIAVRLFDFGPRSREPRGAARGLPGRPAITDPVACTGPQPTGAVPWIRKMALAQRQASTTDALCESSLQPFQFGHPLVDTRRPAPR